VTRERDPVDLDGARLRVVEPAQQLGEGGLACAVLPDDGEGRAGRDGQVEVAQDGLAGRGIAEGQVAEADLARRQSLGRPLARHQRARRAGAVFEVEDRRHGGRRPVERPVEAAERDHRCTDRRLRVDDHRPEREAAGRRGVGERPEHGHVGGRDQDQTREHRALAQAGRLVLEPVQERAAGDEPLERPPGQAEETQLLGR